MHLVHYWIIIIIVKLEASLNKSLNDVQVDLVNPVVLSGL